MMRKKTLLLLWTACLMATATMAANKKFTLVIDAGHGGHDTGAVGAVSKEKNLTLKYALAFGRMVERNSPDVRVVYTRTTDKFVELYRRAEIANNAKADLFISVHINAVPRGRVARGFQTYTLGTSRRTGKRNGVYENLEVAKRENSVILIEKDYKQRYQGFDPNSPESNIMFEFIQDKNMERSVELARYMQRRVCAATGRQNGGAHQDNLAVLRLTSMPGCLIELGFISTRDEEDFMNSSDATERYARGIYQAFLDYKRRYHSDLSVPYKADPDPESITAPKAAEPTRSESTESKQEAAAPTTEAQQDTKPETEQQPAATAAAAPVFKVQVVAHPRKLSLSSPLLKGRSAIEEFKEDGMYKYTIGSSADYDEINKLCRNLQRDFPGCFIVAFRDGQKTDLKQAIREYQKTKSTNK